MNIENEYIKNIDSLIPCPTIALEVLEMAHGAGCDFSELARKIESDPNLTANMLRMANSAYFGHMKKIASVRDIVVRLGLESVKMIAITGASVGLLKNPQQAYNLEAGALWQHSQATATLASVIAKHARLVDSFSIYTAALLHDIGKVILNRALQKAIIEYPTAGEEKNMLALEQKLLQTDHARVGMVLLESWGLPAEISVPVGFHHNFNLAPSHKESVRLVYLANALVEGMGFSSVEGQVRPVEVDDVVSEDVYGAIPNFQQNLEDIVDEFYRKMNEASSLDNRE